MSASNQKLNDELLQIALKNFDEFCSMIGFDITHAYICMLKTKGFSYRQIAIKLGKTRDEVRGIHRRNCGCIQPQQQPKT